MKFVFLFFVSLSFCNSYAGQSQLKPTLLSKDEVKMELPDDPFMANSNCGGFLVVMEANSRSTVSASITFLKDGVRKKQITLNEESCYGYLSCFRRGGDEIVVVMADDACGGNAMNPNFFTVSTTSFLHKLLDWDTAIERGFVEY